MVKGTKDKEIEALASVSDALADLEQDAIGRILQWAANRYGVQAVETPDGEHEAGDDESPDGPGHFEDVGDLFAAASPSTEAEKALVVAYWFQEIKGEADFGSQTVNTQLKHLGHGIGNITDALQQLIDKRPSLVIQTRKKGKTKQARKQYKLTTEGCRKVDKMLRSGDEG